MSVGEQRLTPPTAPRGIDRILELQQLDVAMDRLKARLDTLEAGEALKSARQQRADAESRLGELQLALDAVRTEQRRLESDVDSLERKIEAERKRLFDGSVANARELQSIEAEVGGLRSRKSRVEDLLIELMERREEMETRQPSLEEDVATASDQLSKLEEGSARELVELEQELRDREASRVALLPAFDEELLGLYEDLRRQKRGVAAAGLVDGVCQACHQQLSAVYLDRLKRAEGIRRCEHCRRILVL